MQFQQTMRPAPTMIACRRCWAFYQFETCPCCGTTLWTAAQSLAHRASDSCNRLARLLQCSSALGLGLQVPYLACTNNWVSSSVMSEVLQNKGGSAMSSCMVCRLAGEGGGVFPTFSVASACEGFCNLHRLDLPQTPLLPFQLVRAALRHVIADCVHLYSHNDLGPCSARHDACSRSPYSSDQTLIVGGQCIPLWVAPSALLDSIMAGCKRLDQLLPAAVLVMPQSGPNARRH